MKCNYCKNIVKRNLTLKEICLPERVFVEQLCTSCLKKFEPLSSEKRCEGCFCISTSKFCKECYLWKKKYPDYSFHHEALYSYNQMMKEWFQEYKFKGNYDLRFSFSIPLREYFRKKKKWLIVPIPISKERMNDRGFNQVTGLLKGAEVTYHSLLVRKKTEKSQVQKGRDERLALKQPFEITKEGKQLIKKRSIILVDDIYTTGRTLFHASDILLTHSPSGLYTFSLAR